MPTEPGTVAGAPGRGGREEPIPQKIKIKKSCQNSQDCQFLSCGLKIFGGDAHRTWDQLPAVANMDNRRQQPASTNMNDRQQQQPAEVRDTGNADAPQTLDHRANIVNDQPDIPPPNNVPPPNYPGTPTLARPAPSKFLYFNARSIACKNVELSETVAFYDSDIIGITLT